MVISSWWWREHDFYFSFLGSHPNWRTHIQRGRYITRLGLGKDDDQTDFSWFSWFFWWYFQEFTLSIFWAFLSHRGRKMVKHQANSADEKQLQAHLKRLGLNNIPGAPPREHRAGTGRPKMWLAQPGTAGLLRQASRRWTCSLKMAACCLTGTQMIHMIMVSIWLVYG